MPKDRVYRLPRIWSNQELQKVASLFDGDVVNVSAWKDSDKEGKRYRDYFSTARSYTITNFKSEARGYQGLENEIFMDLEADLPEEMVARFDVVYNHTTVEHIYDFQKAIKNICRMSRDVVIIVLPFLQQYHSDYGDYWRFSPLAIRKLFEENDMTLVYQSFNSHPASSVYTFTIAAKNPDKWREHFNWTFSCVDQSGHGNEPYIGCHAIPNWGHRIKQWFRRLLGKSSS